MKILTSAQMKEIDRKAIAGLGIPGTVLMENAGIRVVEVLVSAVEGLDAEADVVIVAGKGNNGGDGFVVARHLQNMGLRPSVLLLAAKDEVKGDAAVNLDIASKMGIPIAEVVSPEDWKRFRKALAPGRPHRRRDLRDRPDEARRGAACPGHRGHQRGAGLQGGRGHPLRPLVRYARTSSVPAVRADLTVTLAAPKIAHVLPPAEGHMSAGSSWRPSASRPPCSTIPA